MITTEQMFSVLNVARVQSVCNDDQVGSVLYIPKFNAMTFGYNHVRGADGESCELPDGTTKPEVMHAEEHAMLNAVGLFAYEPPRGDIPNSSLFVDRRPCAKCTPKILANRGIKVVVYYRGRPDMDHLKKFEEQGIVIGHGIKDAERLNQALRSLR